MSEPRLQAFADPDALAEGCSRLIADILERALDRRGQAAIIVTGGTTPAATYRRLSQAPLAWDKVAVTLSDERWVAPASEDSNERLVRETLLVGPAAAAHFVPLWSQAESPEAAARVAEPDIRRLCPFDCVLLGMGEDGHIASLFPGSPALEAGLDPGAHRLCIGVPRGEPMPPQPRISLTLPALLNGRIVLLISGEAKRQTVQAALDGADLPVRRVLGQGRAPVSILWSP